MSKEFLQKVFTEIPNKQYTWSLYFFRIDRRGNNPFKVYKMRFKDDQSLSNYAKDLISNISKYKVEPLSQVQVYDGENSKISCDKLSVTSELIAEQWKYLCQAVAAASDEEIKGKINGYILVGQPFNRKDDVLPITLVKVANPIIEVKGSKSIVYTKTSDNELDLMCLWQNRNAENGSIKEQNKPAEIRE